MLHTVAEKIFRIIAPVKDGNTVLIKVIVLLDEYDTPLQESYAYGYWRELTAFTRSLFNATFKTNPYLERAIMTGITRVSKESIFSDLNNLEVITTTSEKYATLFGFTESEVFTA